MKQKTGILPSSLGMGREEKKTKMRFVETLLIVSALLITIPSISDEISFTPRIISIFLFFIIFSILYYSGVSMGLLSKEKNSKELDKGVFGNRKVLLVILAAFMVSVNFSAVISFQIYSIFPQFGIEFLSLYTLSLTILLMVSLLPTNLTNKLISEISNTFTN